MHFDPERLVVIRTGFLRQGVAWIGLVALLYVFLQEGLVVLFVLVFQYLVDLRDYVAEDEAPAGLEAGVKVVRPNDRFQRIREKRSLGATT